jgi:HSP20 family protein
MKGVNAGMFGFNRWNAFGDLFNFQREMDRFFERVWNELPARTAGALATPFQVNTTDDGWRIDVPLPGVDPEHVALEAAGNTLTIRVEEPGDSKGERVARFEQTLTVPQFLDLDKISASHRHGMLRLMLPLKESVKPRRIQIDTRTDDKRQLTGAAA